MPWLPFYASATDYGAIRDHLNSEASLAYITSAGPGKWVAVRTVESLVSGHHCLWHIPSGPLPLLRGKDQDNDQILDPFVAWTEVHPGADPSTPYFGAGHPGVFWLNLNVEGVSKQGDSVVGLSSFEWIGNHYRIIGNAAQPETEAYWKVLRRWVAKSAVNVPRGGPSKLSPPEIWAFSGAQLQFSQGTLGGNG